MIGAVSRTRAVITAATVLVALALGGCSSDDPEPKFSPTPTESSPTMIESSPTETIDGDREQQEDMLVEFFDEVSAAITTGESGGFVSMTSPECANCRVLVENLDDAFANGGSIQGGQWTTTSITYRREARLGSIWWVDVTASRERWLDRQGKTVKIVRGGDLHFGVALEPSGGTWRIRELRLMNS